MIFATLYRLNWAAPRAATQLLRDAESWVRIENCQPSMVGGDVVVEHVGTQTRIEPVQVVSKLPRGDYLSMQTKVPRDAGSGTVLAAKVKHAAYAATLELRWPGILARCAWEDIIQSADVTHVAMDGPMRFRAPISATAAEIEASYATDRLGIDGRTPELRSRFQLASRWYTRGLMADSPFDRFLFLFTALEVFPAMNTADVVRPVTELVHQYVAPELTYAVVKERIGIGRVFGTRSEIVHNGLAVVDITRSPDFDLRLKQLEAIAGACMRVLAGMPPGTTLRQFLQQKLP